ncbi:MAG: DUF4924 family protein [Paludibacteraceae bacterium]|nr:DUF4924 family protein [Paludibacteraceae bacterium]
MFLAHEIKQRNIAEYLLYMWQIEDIIRSFGADIDKIDTELIAHLGLTAEQQKQEHDWYESIIDMMRREDVMQKGHIQLVKNILIDLQDCHLHELQEGNDAVYVAKYHQIMPSVMLLKTKTTDPTISDLEMCFVFLYGIMMMRLQNKPLTPDTEKTAKAIGGFIALLVKKYNEQDKELNSEV